MIELVIRGRDETRGALKDIAGDVDAVGEAGRRSESRMGGFFNTLKGLGSAAMLGIAGGLGAAAYKGLSFNNSMEQASARINAFTKDAGLTKQILDNVAAEASKTPFAFEEMADATAALGPVAKSSGVALMDMVKQAEILAASNPAEGLTGAAFALKEAMGGDFTSAIERFNLSRQYINQLKEEGVPAMEIMSRAMQQAGYDADLVSNMANTASGRWSTFTDTFTTLAGKITQPIFNAFSEGLGNANGLLEQWAPKMEAAATAVAGFITWVLSAGGPLDQLWQFIQPIGKFLMENWQPAVAAAGAIMGAILVPALLSAAAAFGTAMVAAAPMIALFAAIGLAAAALQLAWANNFLGIREIVAQVFGWITDLVSSAMLALQGITNIILGIFTGDWRRAGEGVMQVVEGLVNFIGRILGGLVYTLAQIGANLFQGALDIGVNVIRGIIEGIGNFAGFLWDAAINAARGALDAIKRFLGIASPSAVFAMSIGLPIVQGIAAGIDKGAPEVADATAGLAGKAVGAAQSAVSNVTNVGGITINTTGGQRADQVADFTLNKLQTSAGMRR